MQFYKTVLTATCLAIVTTAVSAKTQEAIHDDDIKPTLSEDIKKLATSIADSQERDKNKVNLESFSVNNAPRTHHRDINQIAESMPEVVQQVTGNASALLEQSQKDYKLNSTDIDNALKAPDYSKFGTGGEYGDESAMSAAMAAAEQQAVKQKETRYGDDVYAYIAVSMSMPERWFSKMLSSLANEHKDKRVMLAFQGAKPGEFAKLALAIEQTMPKNNHGSYSVVIDPTIFMRLEIDKVPTFVINTDDGWRKVLGELSLTQAEAYAAQNYDVYEALGTIYDIEEPNMITLLEERMLAELENDPVKKMQDKVQGFTPAKVRLPNADSTYEYMVTPTFTVQQDLKFEGTVFARKGDTVNTLEHLPLTEKYAFIDLSDAAQIEQARKWQAELGDVRIFSKTLPPAKEMGKYIKEFGYISQINALLVERFSIEAIPSLAFQVGNQLKIQVAEPPRR